MSKFSKFCILIGSLIIIATTISELYLLDLRSNAKIKEDIYKTTIILNKKEIDKHLKIKKILDNFDNKIKIISDELKEIYKENKKPSYEDIKKYVVECYGSRVVVDPDTLKAENEGWMGTGFIIAKTEKYTYIMTNSHVAGYGKPNVSMSVRTDETKVRSAHTIGICEDRDLAILKVEGNIEDKEIIKGFVTPNYQDKVYVVGHHLGRLYTYGEGVVAGYDDKDEEGDRLSLLIQVPCLYGNSGSPVFNTNLEVIGVIFAINMYNSYGGADVAHAVVVRPEDAQRFMDIIMESENE